MHLSQAELLSLRDWLIPWVPVASDVRELAAGLDVEAARLPLEGSTDKALLALLDELAGKDSD